MKTAFNNLTESDFKKMAEANSVLGYENIAAFRGEGEEKELVRNVADPILATLVNKEGFIQIGNIAYRFYRDKFLLLKIQLLQN